MKKKEEYIDGISLEEFTHIQETLDERIQDFIEMQRAAKKLGRPGARPSIATIKHIAEEVAAFYGINIDRLNY